MGSICKRERVWYLDIRVNGRRVRKRVGASKKVAELALKDAEVSVARDEFGFARSDISIEKFVISYLEYSKANHQPKTTDRYGVTSPLSYPLPGVTGSGVPGSVWESMLFPCATSHAEELALPRAFPRR